MLNNIKHAFYLQLNQPLTQQQNWIVLNKHDRILIIKTMILR